MKQRLFLGIGLATITLIAGIVIAVYVAIKDDNDAPQTAGYLPVPAWVGSHQAPA